MIGPLAADLDDLALLYRVMAGPDPLDSTTLEEDGDGEPPVPDPAVPGGPPDGFGDGSSVAQPASTDRKTAATAATVRLIWSPLS